jgi:uncharacterized protein (DUF1778 family)
VPLGQQSKMERIDVRVSAQVKVLLQEAARASNKNVSEFFQNTGIALANETLAGQRMLALAGEQWDAFQAALDGPVQNKPQLQKLLTVPRALG